MDRTPLICDYGSGFSKVGFAGTETPLAVFPTVIGKLKHNNLLVGVEEQECFIGDEVQNNLERLNLDYPITQGTITNWDNMEKIWHHTFYNVLHIAPEQHPVMITEPPLNSKHVKSRTTQFSGQGMICISQRPPRPGSSSSAHHGTGTTIESGEGMTYIVPVVNGYPLPLSTIKLDVAGQDLTAYLLQLLSNSGNLLVSTADREYVRNLKEKHSYVALDYDMEISKASGSSIQKTFHLPDGKEVNLGQEAFMCLEALFKTSLVGKTKPGIHMQAQESITSCDHSHWKTLFGNIMLSGGTGACTGLQFRLQREIARLVSPDVCVQVATSPYAKYGAWVGASILCSLPLFKNMWVTSHEYREIGSSVTCRRNL
ncbi:actin-3-like isoform X3 [Cricetulus griseus]|uniref:Actin-3-like isoform X3 n=1 Tax=Cricetulus griseus TaxID=10029 RepID=A0A9J7GST9_CRIGR|nr:actin-3-like isoform X3 [Cricetulus griseus]XP_035313797.1 actin-3-like isoform X3 [Cricetulus griseus]